MEFYIFNKHRFWYIHTHGVMQSPSPSPVALPNLVAFKLSRTSETETEY